MRTWFPKEEPKAVMIAMHGFNDYSRAFEWPGKYFAARGIATYAYDQRGFGASENIGIWASEDNLTQDLRTFATLIKKRHPNIPLYILGESMGGAVAILTLTQAPMPQVKGVILSAPAVWNINAFMRAPLWLLSHTLPFYTMTGENLRVKASDNIEMLKKLSADPLVIKATRVDAIYGLAQLMGNAYEKAPELTLPTLLLYGDHDEIIPPEPVKETADRLPTPHRVIYYSEGYHMLLRDVQREKVMSDVVKWIAARK